MGTSARLTERIRLGIVGLGRAASAMLPSFEAHPNIDIVAAADPNDAARSRFAERFRGTTFSDVRSMLAADGLDAVYIATPHQLHLEHALAAAAAGKHFIVEKPLALTFGDCSRIVEAARKAGVVSLVGHTSGFDPGIRRMRQIIAAGELGRLRMISCLAYTDFLYRPRRREELDSRAGGGIMYNQIPHQIDMLRVLAQEPIRSVRATAGIWDPARPTEGAMGAFLEFESGVCATLTYSGYDHFDSDEFCGWIGPGGRRKSAAHGSARKALSNAGAQSELEARIARGVAGGASQGSGVPAHQPHFGLTVVSCERGDMRIGPDGLLIYGDEGLETVPLPPGRANPNRDPVADDFVAAVLRGVPPLQDAAWGMTTMEAVLALIRSSAERREVLLSPSETTTNRIPLTATS